MRSTVPVKYGMVRLSGPTMHGALGFATLTTLATRIRTARKAQGLSQEGLARVLNISRNTVAGWETKGAIPGHVRIPGLARALGVSEEVLLGWIREEVDGRPVQPPNGGNPGAAAEAGLNAAIEKLSGESALPRPRKPGRRASPRRDGQPS